MIVVVCPGQGSQTPGFLAPWLEQHGAADFVSAASDAAQVDLGAAGTTWDADAIRDTSVAQPLIVAASLLAWRELAARLESATATTTRPGVAGHSVGEIAALAVAGVLDVQDAMRLVGVRGRAMARAAAHEATGMSAVVGGDQDAVLSRLAELDLTPANYNGGGQIVAAGALAPLDALAAEPVRGSRVIPLHVAGAFHTRYMEPAVQELRDAASDIPVTDPDRMLWTNHDGTLVDSGTDALDLLIGQVASPVRWDLCMSSFAEHEVSGIIELAPAGTLVGLAKRALRGVPSVAVKTPEDLDAALELITGASA